MITQVARNGLQASNIIQPIQNVDAKTIWMVFEKRGCIKNTSSLFWYLAIGYNWIWKLKDRWGLWSLNVLGSVCNFSETFIFSKHMDLVLIKAEKATFSFWKYVNRFVMMESSIILNLFPHYIVQSRNMVS